VTKPFKNVTQHSSEMLHQSLVVEGSGLMYCSGFVTYLPNRVSDF
jgi:hypothetical protein